MNRTHVAFHEIFDNRLPHEQIGYLMSINKTALSEEFKHKIQRQILKDPQWIYENGVIIPR